MRNKRTMIAMIIIVIFAATSVFSQKVPVSDPKAPASNPKEDTIDVEKCNALLDKMQGKWMGEYTKDELKYKTTVSFKKVVQNKFTQGYIKTVDTKGNVEFEALLMFGFDQTQTFLMYTFDANIRSQPFLGKANPDVFKVSGLVGKIGFEHYTWEFNEKGNLVLSHWDAKTPKMQIEGPPAETVVLYQVD